MISNDQWTKSKTACLYRYNSNGQYFARVRFGGKLHRKKLGTDDYQLARRKLADFRRDLGRTDARASNTSFGAALDKYARTFGGLSPSSQKDKRAVIGKLKATWFGIDTLPLRLIKPSDVSAWLSRHCGDQGASYHNSVLTVIRDTFDRGERPHHRGQPGGASQVPQTRHAATANPDARAVQADRCQRQAANPK